MNFVIFSGGIIRKGFFVNEALEKANKVLAVDNGAKYALELGVTPQLVLGDFDSIDNKTLKQVQTDKNVEIIRFPKEKNETDTELGIQEAVKQGASEITIIGGIEGDRLDHILANVFLLTQFEIPILFANGNQKIWLSKGPKKEIIQGKKNDLLSLIPIKDNVEEITTNGLEYKLDNQTLFFGKSRGISNVFLENEVKIKFEKGILLFAHTMI